MRFSLLNHVIACPLFAAVCKKVIGDIKERASDIKDHEKVETALANYCGGTKKESREKKLVSALHERIIA